MRQVRSRKKREVRVARAVEPVPHLVVVALALGPERGPHLGVSADETVGVVPDDLPEFDERHAGVAALDSIDFNVAAEQLVEDGPAAEERLVVGGNPAGESLNDPAGLSSLAARPFDQHMLERGAGHPLLASDMVDELELFSPR